jgi:urease accessory protein
MAFPMDANLARFLQLGDSTLPVGAFSFSHGLETAVSVGLVKDKETLEEFVRSAVRQAAGVDGIALIHAHRLAQAGDLESLVAADHTLLARKLNEETRTMSLRMGRKLAEFAKAVMEAGLSTRWLDEIAGGRSPGNYAIGQGMLFAESGLSLDQAFAVQTYGTASTILGASLRLMRIDHLTTQRILYQVNQDIPAELERVRGKSLQDMAAYNPALDIIAAVHVKAHVRLFMN